MAGVSCHPRLCRCRPVPPSPDLPALWRNSEVDHLRHVRCLCLFAGVDERRRAQGPPGKPSPGARRSARASPRSRTVRLAGRMAHRGRAPQFRSGFCYPQRLVAYRSVLPPPSHPGSLVGRLWLRDKESRAIRRGPVRHLPGFRRWKARGPQTREPRTQRDAFHPDSRFCARASRFSRSPARRAARWRPLSNVSPC